MNGNRNKRSVLLTNDENEIIVSMLGHRCKVNISNALAFKVIVFMLCGLD